jgi:hypothetical protein
LSIYALRGISDDSFAERAAKAIENGCLQEKGTHRLGLMLEHLLQQIVHDIVLTPGERRDKIMDITVPLHRERSQLQPGNPPLGPRLQGSDIILQ